MTDLEDIKARRDRLGQLVELLELVETLDDAHARKRICEDYCSVHVVIGEEASEIVTTESEIRLATADMNSQDAAEGVKDVLDNERIVETEDENPYEPDGFGSYDTVEVRDDEYAGCISAEFPVPSIVTDWFDAERVHFRERNGRVEIAPGAGDDGQADYKAANTPTVGNQTVIEMLDVVPGDEVHYEPDEENGVVVVTPERVAERDQAYDIDVGSLVYDHGLTDDEQAIVEKLAEHGEQSGPQLQTATGQSGSFYKHVSQLVDVGIVTSEQDPEDGRRTLYDLDDNAVEEYRDTERQQAEAVFGGGADA